MRCSLRLSLMAVLLVANSQWTAFGQTSPTFGAGRSADNSGGRAAAVGPSSRVGQGASRLFEVQPGLSTGISSRRSQSESEASNPAAATETATAGRGSARNAADTWEAERTSNARRVAEAHVESYRNRLELLRQTNYYAPPETDRFHESWVIPGAASITPVRTDSPVQLFSPSSTFAHSMDAAERRLREAELELNALNAQIESRSASGSVSGNATSTGNGDASLPASSAGNSAEPPAVRATRVMAELELARHRLDEANRRVEQSRRLSALTYSVPFSELSEEIRLQQIRAEALVNDLEAELKSLSSRNARERNDRGVSASTNTDSAPAARASSFRRVRVVATGQGGSDPVTAPGGP